MQVQSAELDGDEVRASIVVASHRPNFIISDPEALGSPLPCEANAKNPYLVVDSELSAAIGSLPVPGQLVGMFDATIQPDMEPGTDDDGVCWVDIATVQACSQSGAAEDILDSWQRFFKDLMEWMKNGGLKDDDSGENESNEEPLEEPE